MRKHFRTAAAIAFGSIGRSTIALSATAVVNAALGAAYWWAAAQLYSPEAVGVSAGAVSAMTLIAPVCTLGLGTLLIRELRFSDAGSVLLGPGIAAAGLVGAGVGLVSASIFSHLSHDLSRVVDGPVMVALYVSGAGALSAGLVFDQAMLGTGRASLQLYRNALFASGKLLFIISAATAFPRNASLLVGSWAVAAAASLIFVLKLQRVHVRDVLRADVYGELVRMAPRAGRHHAFNLALLAPPLALPVIVAAGVSARAMASFYVAWLISGFLYVLPTSLSLSLFAAGNRPLELFRRQLRIGLTASIAAGAAAVVVLAVGGEAILGVFGASYAGDGKNALLILGAAVIPVAVKSHFVALVRINDDIGRVAPLLFLGAATEVCVAAAGLKVDGTTGLAAGWFVVLALEALVMTFPMRRFLRGRGGRTLRPT